ASLFLHLFNLDWGTELENFNLADSQRATHRLVPWPFYTFTSGRDHAPYIHLSDGGNTDNIGMLAQLRRGVRHIVVSASTMDREGRFPSPEEPARARWHLPPRGARTDGLRQGVQSRARPCRRAHLGRIRGRPPQVPAPRP